MDFAARTTEISTQIVAHRRHLHRNPELSFHEQQTTAYLTRSLERMGIPVQSFSDYTGCIALIEGDRPGPTVLLRADIDALPIQENSGVEFQSVNEGVMHACGHDCHSAMLLGAAQLLWERRQALPGRVKLLFQAAEERFIGSHYYWDRGHLLDVEAAMGMHVWAEASSGCVCIQDGPVMASCDNFTITVHGVSAHGSTPHQGQDAIVAASAIICNLQTAVSRMSDPLDALVITVGTVRAGAQFNIITDTAVLEGTVRAQSARARQLAEPAIRRIADQTAQALGCTARVDYRYLIGPVCNNHAKVNELARGAAGKLFGEAGLQPMSPAMGSEDFAYFMERIPASVFVFLGCHDERSGCIYPIHNEKFKINEDILPRGAALYAQFAADYLQQAVGGGGA